MNAVSQWWIGGLRTRKAKVAGSIPAGGSRRFFPDLKFLTGLANQEGEMSEYSRIPKSIRLDETSKLLTFTTLSESLRKTIEFQSKDF